MMLALGFIAVTALIGLGTTGGVEEGYDVTYLFLLNYYYF